jgi:hypothetical protein
VRAQLFNAAGTNGRDCPLCFRTGTMCGPRVERATLECSGCFARFLYFRGAEGEPDTLKRIFLTVHNAPIAAIAIWPLALAAAILLGSCASEPPVPSQRGAGVETPWQCEEILARGEKC